jgi:amino acid permease
MKYYESITLIILTIPRHELFRPRPFENGHQRHREKYRRIAIIEYNSVGCVNANNMAGKGPLDQDDVVYLDVVNRHDQLQRGLKSRHIQFLALGGA